MKKSMYLFYMKPKILENTCRIITFILLIQLNAFDIIIAITIRLNTIIMFYSSIFNLYRIITHGFITYVDRHTH